VERIEVANGFGNVRSHPKVVVDAMYVEEIVAILRDRERYPNPVRAVGSNDAATPCGAADGGTLIVMRKMDRIVEIGEDLVTAQAGALYSDVARELREHDLQFFVNADLGGLTMGAAACGGAAGASMPGELGQTASYATSIKMVTPAGELVEITEADGELMRVARSSLGLLGIVTEVTFRVRPLAPMWVHQRRYGLEAFARELPLLTERAESIALSVDPFTDTVLVELRGYHDEQAGEKLTGRPWSLRSAIRARWAPLLARIVDRVPVRPAHRVLGDLCSRLVVLLSTRLVTGERTAAPAQLVERPSAAGGRSTSSTWAFPEERYADCLRRYFELSRRYEREHGYRPNLLGTGRRIAADESSLLSCSSGGAAMTLDPVSTGGAGWEGFLRAFNDLCGELDGVPALDQTGLLTRAQVDGAFVDRAALLDRYRRRYDPADRMLNPYFAELLGPTAAVEGPLVTT